MLINLCINYTYFTFCLKKTKFCSFVMNIKIYNLIKFYKFIYPSPAFIIIFAAGTYI